MLLRDTFDSKGGAERAVRHRISVAWFKSRELNGCSAVSQFHKTTGLELTIAQQSLMALERGH